MLTELKETRVSVTERRDGDFPQQLSLVASCSSLKYILCHWTALNNVIQVLY